MGRRTADQAQRVRDSLDELSTVNCPFSIERELLGLVADLALCVEQLSQRLDAAEELLAARGITLILPATPVIPACADDLQLALPETP